MHCYQRSGDFGLATASVIASPFDPLAFSSFSFPTLQNCNLDERFQQACRVNVQASGYPIAGFEPDGQRGDDNAAAEACNLLERVTEIMQEAAVGRPLNSKLKASSTQIESWNCWSDFTTNQFAWSVLLLAVLLFLPLLGGRDLWAPVEPRYAEIVRIMFAKGEWVVPTVNGDLYTDKPILYFWLALIASKLAGG